MVKKWDNVIALLGILIVTVIMGSALGLSIINVINTKLSEISINMPQINLPKQEIVFRVPENASSPVKVAQTGGNLQPSLEKVTEQRIKRDFSSPLDLADQTELLNMTQPESHIVSRFDVIPAEAAISSMQQNKEYASKMNKEMSEKSVGCQKTGCGCSESKNECSCGCGKSKREGCSCGCHEMQQSPADHETCPNQCLETGRCLCHKGYGPDCGNSKPSYYKDPKDMTPRQQRKFMTEGKFDKMTPRDYQNWLLLYTNNRDYLSPYHYYNLDKALRGEKLCWKDMPTEETPKWPTAQEYHKLRYGDEKYIPYNLYIPGGY